MKATRAILFGVFSVVQGGTLIVRDVLKSHCSLLDRDGVDWLFLLGTVVVSGVSAQVLYYKWLWRWVRMKQNLRGTWSFNTTYGPSLIASDVQMDGQGADISARAHCKYPNPKPTSDGKVEIDQDPDGIRFNQRTGELIKDVSSARHLAIEFDEDRHVEMLLEITAYSDHDKGGFFRYIQSETITITEWKPVCRFWRKPSLMTGTFRTAFMTDAELAEARRHRPDWVPPCGTTVYKLLEK